MTLISAAFGRFNPLTREHERLLDKLSESNSDYKYIFVFGKKEQPLKINDRISYLKWIYPKISIIPCTKRYCESPLQALSWMYYEHKSSDLHLELFCGIGNKGIQKGWNEGASLEELNRLFLKYNGQPFPRKKKIRMNWMSVTFRKVERGQFSGSLMRKTAKLLDYNNEEHVQAFMNGLHSRINFNEAWRILRLLNMKYDREPEEENERERENRGYAS